MKLIYKSPSKISETVKKLQKMNIFRRFGLQYIHTLQKLSLESNV